MAFLRQNEITEINLSTIVSQRISQLKSVVARTRMDKEAAFQKAVLENDISLTEQLKYRQGLVDAEKGKNVVDEQYLKEQKLEVSNLRKRIRVQEYREEYQLSLNAYKSGNASAAKHKQFLEEHLKETNDPDLRNEILQNIGSVESDMFQNARNAIANQFTFAMNDKTTLVLSKAINDIKVARQNALLIADTATATLYDTNLTTLQRELTMAKIQDEENDIDISVLTGGSVDNKLNWFIDKKNKAQTAEIPFFYDGVKYDSEQQYWDARFGAFMTDKDNGFLAQKKNELTTKYTTLFNRFGDITVGQIQNLKKDTDNILNNENLLPWKSSLTAFAQDVLIGASNMKLGKLQKDVQIYNDLRGITSVRNQVAALQAAVPDISLSSAFVDLQKTYATAASGLLSTMFNEFKSSKQNQLDLWAEAVDNSGADEATRNKAKNVIAQQQAQFGTMLTKLAVSDIPLASFTFDKTVTQMFSEMMQPYGGLLNQPQVEGVNIDDWIKTLLGGTEEQTKVASKGTVAESPSNSKTQTPTGGDLTPKTNVPIAPPVPKNDYEKSLDILGDENKQKTMAGYGWQWKYTDSTNKVGGWIPATPLAKQKFKELYGTDFNNKTATMQLGGKKIITYAYEPYSAGLAKQGYQLMQ